MRFDFNLSSFRFLEITNFRTECDIIVLAVLLRLNFQRAQVDRSFMESVINYQFYLVRIKLERWWNLADPMKLDMYVLNEGLAE